MSSPSASAYQALTEQQLDELIAVIVALNGTQLERQSFNEVTLGLLEDVAGFEHLQVNNSASLLNSLWYWYRNQ